MNQTLTQIEKEFDEKFGNTPAIAGKITDSDECCNCGEDLALELYEAFSNGYEMAKDDIRPFLTQSNLRVIENERSRFREMILDVIQDTNWIEEPKSAFGRLNKILSTLIEQK